MSGQLDAATLTMLAGSLTEVFPESETQPQKKILIEEPQEEQEEEEEDDLEDQEPIESPSIIPEKPLVQVQKAREQETISPIPVNPQELFAVNPSFISGKEVSVSTISSQALSTPENKNRVELLLPPEVEENTTIRRYMDQVNTMLTEAKNSS